MVGLMREPCPRAESDPDSSRWLAQIPFSQSLAHPRPHQRFGWHVEWPRIRDVGLPSGKFLMNQHGLMYEFPANFSPNNTAGIRPLSTFHKMIVDYADWNGRLVMGCNDTSAFENPLYGRVNSNFLFMEKDELPLYGERPEGIGSVWYQENVAATPASQSPTDLVAPTRNPSDPMLVSGFAKRVLHLSHGTASPIDFTLQIDANGTGNWSDYQTITVPANGYRHLVLPEVLARHLGASRHQHQRHQRLRHLLSIQSAPLARSATHSRSGHTSHTPRSVGFSPVNAVSSANNREMRTMPPMAVASQSTALAMRLTQSTEGRNPENFPEIQIHGGKFPTLGLPNSIP